LAHSDIVTRALAATTNHTMPHRLDCSPSTLARVKANLATQVIIQSFILVTSARSEVFSDQPIVVAS